MAKLKRVTRKNPKPKAVKKTVRTSKLRRSVKKRKVAKGARVRKIARGLKARRAAVPIVKQRRRPASKKRVAKRKPAAKKFIIRADAVVKRGTLYGNRAPKSFYWNGECFDSDKKDAKKYASLAAAKAYADLIAPKLPAAVRALYAETA